MRSCAFLSVLIILITIFQHAKGLECYICKDPGVTYNFAQNSGITPTDEYTNLITSHSCRLTKLQLKKNGSTIDCDKVNGKACMVYKIVGIGAGFARDCIDSTDFCDKNKPSEEVAGIYCCNDGKLCNNRMIANNPSPPCPNPPCPTTIRTTPAGGPPSADLSTRPGGQPPGVTSLPIRGGSASLSSTLGLIVIASLFSILPL